MSDDYYDINQTGSGDFPCFSVSNGISGVANYIYYDLGQPDDLSVSSITCWLYNNLGNLNNVLQENHSIVDGEIAPGLNSAESGIFAGLFECSYYRKQVSKSTSSTAYLNYWTNIREGDTSISRASPVESAKVLNSVSKDVCSSVNDLINNYRRNKTIPASFTVDRCGGSSFFRRQQG